MTVLYDENIPFGRDAFGTLGSARPCSGRTMSHAMLADVDLLFVRSVTPVNQALLHDTPVSFVATATSGSDHLDKPWLDQAGIAYADAIGSNANSVAEYVVSSLLTLSRRNTFNLEDKTIGIIGVGHVGSIVARNARLLGMTVLLNDPPGSAEKRISRVSLSSRPFLPISLPCMSL